VTFVNTERRTLLKASLAPLLLAFLGREAEAAPLSETTAIRVIQTRDPARTLELVQAPGFARSLAQATLAFVIENYATGNLPVWKKPLGQVDLHARIPQIATHVIQGVIRHAAIYPVDPCWIMAQMMAESFFHEFAVSSALAVGPCQFMAPTARGYGMICADAHGMPSGSTRRPDLEPEFKLAEAAREQSRALRREQPDLFNNPSKLLRTVLNAQASGTPLPSAGTLALALDRMDLVQAQYAQARDNCRMYLEENFRGRSIFDSADAAFFERFDQRVLYAHSIGAMVRMMAEHMRARRGNILAAAAGYNSGLGNTEAKSGVYALYGRIPSFGETVDYVSKIVVNHHEISRRME
jgi:hypothetical protein